jgi:5-methylcytosine-specific restriction endonuclease McrA
MGKWKNPVMLAIKERRARRRRIFTRDSWRCLSCTWEPKPEERNAQVNIDPENRPGRYLTLDHIIPVASGGSNEDTNLRTLCNECNQKRGDLE